MKTETERQKPNGIADYISLAVTTCGVGYLPLAPGTWGSMVGVAIYLGVANLAIFVSNHFAAFNEYVWPVVGYPTRGIFPHIYGITHAVILVALLLFTFLGIWASNRAIALLGNTDPSEAVVDEVIGQLIVFLFVPFAISWPLILAGFILFRFFDIWKPYPIDALQILPGGLGICADDILAGIYGGISLAVLYAGYLYFFGNNAVL
jgi:phosphatidylglycerophosphatase A